MRESDGIDSIFGGDRDGTRLLKVEPDRSAPARHDVEFAIERQTQVSGLEKRGAQIWYRFHGDQQKLGHV